MCAYEAARLENKKEKKHEPGGLKRDNSYKEKGLSVFQTLNLRLRITVLKKQSWSVIGTRSY